MISIQRYKSSQEEEWDCFVESSRQGTFLFLRRYMDYHADRFRDYSLMIYRDEKLFALLPGNASGDSFYSHQGLTYGGLLTKESGTATSVCEVFRILNDYLRRQGFVRVVYKPVPWIYHRLPAEEDLYALFKECGARLMVRNLACTVDMLCPVKWRRDHRYGANKAHRQGVYVEEGGDLAVFWRILEDNLMRSHHATPVHSLDEMRLLMTRFPDSIRLVSAYREDRMLGATLLYICRNVMHAQYISASPEGKRLHAMDAIFHYVLTHMPAQCRYLDFGTSNEQLGLVLNEGLVFQKEGFGGRGIVYDTYEWKL